jgi:hypothetical protein
MTICFGETNFCMVPPRGGRKGTADYSKIKVPERIAKRFGYDPDKTYSMKEIMEKAKQMAPPGFELTESMVASFMGLGAAVNPQPEDLEFYRQISEEYKESLTKNKLDSKRLEPAPAKDGSFELWVYYHLGLPSFSLDFWTLPQLEEKGEGPKLTAEKLEAMSNEKFLALGEEKIDAFLKASGAPGNIKAKMIMNAVKSGMMTTKRMAEMMRQMPKPKSKEGADPKEKALLAFSDKELAAKGFVKWTPFKHPTYGDIDIGGWVKFSTRVPAPFMIKDMVHRNASAVIFSAKHTPEVSMEVFDTREIGKNLYRIRVRMVNSQAMPSMSYHGQRLNLYPRDMLKISGNGIKVIAGGVLKDADKDDVSYKEYRPEIQFFFVPGFGKVEYQFIVSGKGAVTLNYKSRHAGKISKTIQLK